MSSIEKQLILNRCRKLPVVLVGIIKSYAFETKKNVAIMNNTRINKTILMQSLHLLDYWRVRNDEHWGIGVFNQNSRHYSMIEGINCHKCGDYISVGAVELHLIMPEHLFCKCPIVIDDDDFEQDWDF
jgi:hypothetical protein